MEQPTDFHRYHKCPTCETYWKETGRQTVGLVDYGNASTCPTCQGS